MIKYESLKGQPNVLDVNPTIAAALRAGKQAIFVTEGARKADSLATLGIPALNVSGVYGWRSKNSDGGYTDLPDWEMVSIKGSRYILAFDSDILTKPSVY